MSDTDWPSPCVICGYNGPGFHQPETHPCKKNTTERDALIEKIASLKAEVRTLKQTLDCTYGDTPGLIHCPLDKPCAMHEAERISALLNSRKRELQNVVEQICYEFSSTIAHAERPNAEMDLVVLEPSGFHQMEYGDWTIGPRPGAGRCENCDLPRISEDQAEKYRPGEGSEFCWSRDAASCRNEPEDWRTRALKAETDNARLWKENVSALRALETKKEKP